MWLYHRFCLSFREVEVLFAERGVMVTYETVCQWCQKFGAGYARKLKKRQGRLVNTWNINEVFVIMQGPGTICIGRSIRTAMSLLFSTIVAAIGRTVFPALA